MVSCATHYIKKAINSLMRHASSCYATELRHWERNYIYIHIYIYTSTVICNYLITRRATMFPQNFVGQWLWYQAIKRRWDIMTIRGRYKTPCLTLLPSLCLLMASSRSTSNFEISATLVFSSPVAKGRVYTYMLYSIQNIIALSQPNR